MDADLPVPGSLPGAVRARLLALVAEQLGRMPTEDVPPGLRAVARFTPVKRARLGAVALAAALESDPVLRQQAAQGLAASVADAVRQGSTPPAADPVELAAAAYLLRPSGWPAYVRAAVRELEQQAARLAGAAQVDAVQRLTDQLEQVRAAARAELQRAHAADKLLQGARLDVAALRRQLRAMGDRAGRAEAAQQSAEQTAEQAELRAAQVQASREIEVGQLQDQLAEAGRALTAARTARRGERQEDTLRQRLLLDALVGAANGLRRELALPPAEGRPADALAGDYAVAVGPGSAQGRSDDDPLLLAGLLAVPATHLLVDGYNVTKSAYGSLSLEVQRGRLLGGLGGLAARTAAEVTVVFDGADRVLPLAAPAPRGVRLLFSRTGETADEVLRRLVRHEPAGRPLVVVSSDREVIDGVRRSGARPVAAAALVRLLERSVGGPT